MTAERRSARPLHPARTRRSCRRLADALLPGELVPDFASDGDPLALADVTIYRADAPRRARACARVFVEQLGGRSAILPAIRPLGEFDEDDAAFEAERAASIDLAPPIAAIDRLLLLAPLVRAWKRRLPAHVAALFEEEVVVPASAADAIWLARDLAALMDEIETEGADWAKLGDLVSGNLAGWWQVTLDFLAIVTDAWPEVLRERDRSNPAAHRNALIRLEAARLKRNPPAGPVIAAGSTGSIPATAELLVGDRAPAARRGRAARPRPGARRAILVGRSQRRRRSRRCSAIRNSASPSCCGKIGVLRADVEEIGTPDMRSAARAA